jgi:ribonuclease R
MQAEGTLSANRAGYGFVRTEALTESVFLPPKEMRGLMHGDRVRVEVHGDEQGRYFGRLLAVLERGVQAFLGTLESAQHGLVVRAADQRLGFACRVVGGAAAAEAASEAASDATPPRAHGARARAGDWVIARLVRYPQDGDLGEARVERVLDPERPVEMAGEAAIARFGLPVEFPAEVLQEAQRWGRTVDPNEAARREDLRGLPLVTIDGEDAKDFDDAVYAQRLDGGGFRLIVAIADVSHYVQPGSALDREARARGTSVYFPTRVLPMLPTALSNHLCSLEPRVDRLCMVADMRLSRLGALEDSRFYPAVMRSAARLTYTLAHRALFLREPAACAQLGEPLVESLLPLLEVYQALSDARRRRGALEFDAPETQFVLGEDQRVRSVRFTTRNEAHRLIEECMIQANVAVAQHLRARQLPALFRVHAAPDEKKLEQLRATLRILGIELQLPEPVHARDLGQIAPRVRDEHARPFVESLIVRSMAQALYQPENIGHFGLALKDYAHFTSPIRRYPDLLIHRALRALIGLTGPESMPSLAELAAAGTELSRLERRADEAGRFVSTFLKCVYLRDRIGQTFDGLITTVMEFGCFIQLLDIGVDGLLPLAALRGDDYQMARDGGQWLGTHSKRQLAPGVRLRVVVAAVKPVEGQIDLELATD